MSNWTEEQLDEMFGDDIVGRLSFLAGCTAHRIGNNTAGPDGFICSWEKLEQLIQLTVKECCDVLYDNELGSRHVEYALNEHFGLLPSEEDGACPLCGEDGGTRCGLPDCEY